MDSIEKVLYKTNLPPGKKLTQDVDKFQLQDIYRSMRAKRVLDKQVTKDTYNVVKKVHTPLLNYYETNKKWYERDTDFDFMKYMNTYGNDQLPK